MSFLGEIRKTATGILKKVTEQEEDETRQVGPRFDVSISGNMLGGVTWEGGNHEKEP